MALGERNKKNSPLGGSAKDSVKLKNAQKAIESVASRIKYNDFKNTVERIMRAK